MPENSRVLSGYGLIALLVAPLYFSHLGDRALWSDEAETALLARSITRGGVPRMVDEHGPIAYPTAESLGWLGPDRVWLVSPWLDEYVAAPVLWLAPRSAAAARLPFAMAGWLTVLAIPAVAYRVYGSHSIALAAMFLYATCVPVIVHSRQCRYYALLLVAMLLLITGLHAAAAGGRKAGAGCMGLALLMIYYTNYLVALPAIAALGLVALLSLRRNPGVFFAVILAGMVLAALGVPWLIFSRPQQSTWMFSLNTLPGIWLQYAWLVNGRLWTWLVLVFPLWALWRRRRGAVPPGNPARMAVEGFMWIYVLVDIPILSIASFVSFPYVLSIAPVLALLIAAGVSEVITWVPLRWGLLFVVGLLQIVPGGMNSEVPAVPLVSFARSLGKPYVDRTEVVQDYLLRHANPGQSVAVVDNELPLAFRCDLRTYFWHDPQRPAWPDWIVPRSVSMTQEQPEKLVLPPAVAAHYEPIVLTVPRTPRLASHPALDLYRPLTASETEAFPIYRLRPPGQAEGVEGGAGNETPVRPRGN